jgi:hypothetical protein
VLGEQAALDAVVEGRGRGRGAQLAHQHPQEMDADVAA